ncbi:MAG: HEAT repeat domain-containing protein [Gammaproteobacteria bacterium]
MGLFNRYKASKAIETLLTASSGSSADAIQATLKLKQIGSGAVPQLLEALPQAANTAALEGVLAGFVSNATFALFVDALASSDRRTIEAVTRVLCQSQNFDPNRLIELFEAPETSKSALGRILLAHLERVDRRKLILLLSKIPSNARPVLYQLLDKALTEKDLPLLVHHTKAAEPSVRARMAQMLGKFGNPNARSALIEMLSDPHKAVRQAALEALGNLDIPVPAKMVVGLLRDPDLTVQSKAIETLIKIHDATTVQQLVDILQDDSEYVRRAAVEVLNEVVDQRAIKDLLVALRDKDWWVRVRAADALGKIGGPKLVEAVLGLIKDEDEFLRRTAVEILNTSQDQRALGYLLEALGDEDWWVRERAADALITLATDQTLDSLRDMLQEESSATPMVIRTLANLGDQASIDAIVRHLKSTNEQIRKEAVRALEDLTDEEHTQLVTQAMTQLISISEGDERDLAQHSLQTILSHTSAEAETSSSGAASGEASMLDLSEQVEQPSRPLDLAELVPNTVLGDRYRIVRKVGKGGFGEVFLAEDMVVNDQLILKFLHPHLSQDDNMIKRFIQELRYARKVTHENVIRIYDFITLGKSFAISMEYFPGHSLADELAGKKPLDLQRGIQLALEVCNGMAAAESAEVVHRDLKPANILINEHDRVKIVDYGLAAAATRSDSTLTKTGLLIGTPTYMSPERARGRHTDSRADIYSMGVILYEMFTGKPPYSGGDPMAVLLQHVEGSAAPPDELNPQIPATLSEVIRKAMDPDPDKRYQHFADLRRELQRAAKEMD